MARFLLAWELGGGLGHTVPLAQVAAPLVASGHEVHLVLRDLSTAAGALGALADHPRVQLWQAPVWLAKLQGAPPATCYAELLFPAGYLDPARLASLARAWRNLCAAIAPDLLLAEHAPTALLATRLPGPGRPPRIATLGSGFFLPPALRPMPAFADWLPADPRRVEAAEARALATCNAVLARLGGGAAAPLAALHELTAADAQFLTTWPELDPYGSGPDGRPGGRYWGALTAPDGGAPAVWPDGSAPPVLAYLKAGHPAIDAVLAQLAAAPCRTLAYVSGLTAAQRQRWAGPRLRFADAPVSMRSALAQARAVVCHAGAGTVCATLAAGVPLLLLPTHGEQMLQARRVAATGAGAVLVGPETGSALAAALNALLTDGRARRCAQALAARHAEAAPEAVADRVAEHCAALAAAS